MEKTDYNLRMREIEEQVIATLRDTLSQISQDVRTMKILVAHAASELTEEQACRLTGLQVIDLRELYLQAIHDSLMEWRRYRDDNPVK